MPATLVAPASNLQSRTLDRQARHFKNDSILHRSKIGLNQDCGDWQYFKVGVQWRLEQLLQQSHKPSTALDTSD